MIMMMMMMMMMLIIKLKYLKKGNYNYYSAFQQTVSVNWLNALLTLGVRVDCLWSRKWLYLPLSPSFKGLIQYWRDTNDE